MRFIQRGSRGPTEADDTPLDFQAFVAASGARLFRSACLLTGGDTHAAEDLVQETFGLLYRRWQRVCRVDNPVGYAQTTLVNRFVSGRRKRSNTELPAGTGGFGDVADRPDRGDDVALRLALLAALRSLPPVDRAVLVLRFWEDLTVAETAARLNLSDTAVRSRSSRALARVRDRLGGDFADLARS
ncbi:RNA polymerase sigma-70 factor (sigma-E family) [Catenulispora sp. MAP12-49]|uniref:SigE family RNA polymerase sigma factor n=1 Tax=Catenulispora sp. MAP12-49 TaxID=3156302 RepID=UPI003519708C